MADIPQDNLYRDIKIAKNMKTHTDLGEPSVIALAQIYNPSSTSSVAREVLLEEARMSLVKYDLAEDELEIAADSLARSMQMMLEERGLKKLEPKQIARLECEVLDYCGIGQLPDSVKGENRK
jgi:hypothetical protein